GVQSAPAATSDGAGGVFVSWQDRRAGSDDIYLQHVTGAGALVAGWVANGVAECSAPGDQRAPSMVADDAGGVVLAWQDQRAGNWDGYALRALGNAALAPGRRSKGTAGC